MNTPNAQRPTTAPSQPARPAQRPAAAPSQPIHKPAAAPSQMTVDAAANERERQAQLRFEAKARELLAATPARPALTILAEVDAIRAQYATGAARLRQLEALVATRQAFLDEETGFGDAQLSTLERTEAKSFFDAFGRQRAAQLPPHKSASAPSQAASEKAAPAPSQPAAAPSQGESPAPAAPSQVPPAQVVVHYLSQAGFEFELTFYGATGVAALDQAAAAEKRLVAMGAKPMPLAAPSQASTAPSQKGGEPGPAPKCPEHRSPMKWSKGKKEWYCPRKDDYGEYCDHTEKG